MMRQIAFHNHGAAPIHSNSSTAQVVCRDKEQQTHHTQHTETEQHNAQQQNNTARQRQSSTVQQRQSSTVQQTAETEQRSSRDQHMQ